jgi:hypothetical protein
MKKIIIFSFVLILLSSFVFAATNEEIYYEFSNNLIDSWGTYDLSLDDSPAYVSSYRSYDISGDGSPKSLSFDGINDGAYNTAYSDTYDDISIAIDIYPTRNGVDKDTFFYLTPSGGGAAAMLLDYTGTTLRCGVNDGSVSFSSTSATISLNTWQNVVCTYDGTTKAINLYVDNVFKSRCFDF